ncbi:unnamed protein product [Ambrosiozyma monospora]|uniref:Unnamed protein product n=1 Tax=Ambrosiozyma monospora TaxID=43982 RepID=A0A9W7DJV8_AMBMO|nr:unnamed protein product [Ambrosiozyma monospora]
MIHSDRYYKQPQLKQQLAPGPDTSAKFQLLIASSDGVTGLKLLKSEILCQVEHSDPCGGTACGECGKFKEWGGARGTVGCM